MLLKSPHKTSQITDKLLPVITEWHDRPLDAVYPIVFLNEMHFEDIDGKVISRAFHSVLDVTVEGKRIFWVFILQTVKERISRRLYIQGKNAVYP